MPTRYKPFFVWVALQALGLVVAVPTCAQPLTALYLRSVPGDFVGNGQTIEWSAPQLTVTSSHDTTSEVRFDLANGGDSANIRLEAPLEAPLAAGIYEEAARAAFPGSSPGLEASFNGRGCNTIRGRFVVMEATFDGNGGVASFAANFEQWCDASPAPLYGEIRLNSTVPLSNAAPAPDSLPDPFALNAQSPVRAGTTVQSNPITIYGVNAPVPITIIGGEYSINGGPFTASPATASGLDHIVVRVKASSSPGGSAQATLDAGGRTATLSVQTYQQGMVLTGLYFRSTSDQAVGRGQTRLFMTPRNQLTSLGNFDNGIRIDLAGIGGSQYMINLAAPGDARLEIGSYEDAVFWPTQPADKPGLAFSGDGVGCDGSGRFVIRDVAYALDGSLDRLAADFQQGCTLDGSPVFGEVRVNSAVPFSVFGGACSEAEGYAGCAADVVLSHTIDSNPAASGKDSIFTMTVTNNGPDAAHSVSVSATPYGANLWVWASPGCAMDSGKLRCSVGTLESGGATQFKLVLRSDYAGWMSNTAMANSASTPDSSNSSSLLIASVVASPAGNQVLRYRLYSPVTLEHHFTTDLNEYNTLGTYAGTWVQEGTVGKVLDNPGSFNGYGVIPYYRLYDTANRWHHWTTDPNEYYTLIQYPNWNGEGVDGYILPTNTAGTTQLYRLTYPYIPGLHHWTIDANEYNTLIGTYGWIGEGGSGFVIQ